VKSGGRQLSLPVASRSPEQGSRLMLVAALLTMGDTVSPDSYSVVGRAARMDCGRPRWREGADPDASSAGGCGQTRLNPGLQRQRLRPCARVLSWRVAVSPRRRDKRQDASDE